MLCCPHCHDPHTKKDSRTAGGQRYRCHGCRRTVTDRTGTPFAGYRWERDIIALAVHWSCSYRLSVANVRDLLAERPQPLGHLLLRPAARLPELAQCVLGRANGAGHSLHLGSGSFAGRLFARME
jgi:hypothetical protein